MAQGSGAEPTSSYYDLGAAEYARYADSFTSSDVLGDFLLDVVEESAVLDIGCGSGRDLQAALEKTRRSFGLDISRGLLREAASRMSADLTCGDAVHLPFRSGSFDRAIAIASLHHLDRASQCAALKEIRRVLAPAGQAMVTLKTGRGLRVHRDASTGAERFFHLVGSDTFVDRARAAGFRVAHLAESSDVRRGETQKWLACRLTVDV